jgi:hypothetical protein
MKGIHRFLIQIHQTEHPHFDLLLEEVNGIKTWVFPSAIPLQLSEKRLAIEDKLEKTSLNSPIEFFDDQYGIGKAELWDNGEYELIDNTKMKIIIEANGRKFCGRYVFLVPSWGRWNKKRLWLLFKTKMIV